MILNNWLALDGLIAFLCRCVLKLLIFRVCNIIHETLNMNLKHENFVCH